MFNIEGHKRKPLVKDPLLPPYAGITAERFVPERHHPPSPSGRAIGRYRSGGASGGGLYAADIVPANRAMTKADSQTLPAAGAMDAR